MRKTRNSDADRKAYETLMGFAGTDGLDHDGALQRIGQLIDLSKVAEREDGLTRALEWAAALDARGVPDSIAAQLDYFRANAWAQRAQLRYANQTLQIAMDQPEYAQEILHLRKALNNAAFDKLPAYRRCEILTNLGNALNVIGRFVEALEYWSRALKINPHFWMARGNLGLGLLQYGKVLHLRHHVGPLLLSAHEALTAAMASAALHSEFGYPEAVQAFVKGKAEIEHVLNVVRAKKKKPKPADPTDKSLGASEAERRYRNWCLSHRLFLNPLNDLGSLTDAALDDLRLPDFVTPIKAPPSLIGFFNQLKQEFVSARWLAYEGKQQDKPHFSDREVLLFNTLDYPSYGLVVEKTKIAFRLSYSLLDKVAYFLDAYMDLGIPERAVSVHSVWHEKNGQVRTKLATAENWPMRGLYWLSKDVLDEDFRASTEPDARELHEIRNHLEHKYLKVHEMTVVRRGETDSPSAWLVDNLAFSIARYELEAKTLRLLKLARAALMYLAAGMHREEQRRAEKRGETLIGSMPLDRWDDDWKR